MGVIIIAKVVTGTNKAGWPRLIQPGNKEQVIIIECINAIRGLIPPLIIFKAIMHQAAQYEDNIIPHNQSIGVSENGQTINKISLTWLKLFDKHTKDRTIGTHRLLVLDGHGSYVHAKFNRYCLDYNIIPICMPAHLSHILQPLNVGCFLALKQAYGYGVKQLMGCGVNHINKHEFLPLYR